MIKIHEKLWYIKHHSRYPLAYMTYYEKGSAFEKRMKTGTSWATSAYPKDKNYVEPSPEIIDNVPISGFKILGDVTRWSTSNKLFQIQDPRGFVVEVPSSNLTTLLLHTNIIKAEIQGDCIWGKDNDNANNILLPVNSKPYTEVIQKQLERKSKVFIDRKELKVGDWVKVQKYNTEYFKELYFAGRIRITWRNVRTEELVKDRWIWGFLSAYKKRKEIVFHGESPKVTSVERNEKIILEGTIISSTYVPKRISSKFKKGYYDNDRVQVAKVEYK